MYALIIITLLTASAHGFVGYDCGTQATNITTVSLIEVGECDIPENAVTHTKQYIQLLQLNEYSETKVMQCKVEIHRTLYVCGMFHHVSIVHNGEREYISDLSREACEIAHTTGTMKIGDTHIVQGLKINATSRHSAIFVGSVTSDGKCDGAGYSDPFGSWEDVVAQGTVTITLTQYVARVALDSNHIHLRSGTVCPLTNGHCVDSEGANTFWDPIPTDNCGFSRYSVLFEGIANKIKDHDVSNPQTMYTLATQDITFALAARNKDSVCGYIVTRTEHPKLVVFETAKGESFAISKKISVSNLDIFAYVNSKFVYVEKHIRTQIKQLYRDVMTQRCNIERQTIKNALSIAHQSPDEFAYNLMKGPGYMAITAGEVVHIIKCVPVEVKIEHVQRCYAELRVTHKNATYYLTPKTHILKSKGTEVTCNSLLPSFYQVGGRWIKLIPTPATTDESIQVLKPGTKPTWNYTNPAELATDGIYQDADLNRLRESIMFPVERPALLNDLAREMNGHPIIDKDGALLKLLNEDAVEKLAESTWNRLWTKFMTFGTVSAGIIAILMIFQFMKMTLDVALRGYALHSVFGWSLRLLGALWGTLTHFLLYQHNQSRTQTSNIDGQYPEIVIERSPTPAQRTQPPEATAGTSSTAVQTPKTFFSIAP